MRKYVVIRLFFMISLIALLSLVMFVKPAPASAQTNWSLVWEDNFNGSDGSAPDSTKWNYDLGGGGWGNSELEYYTNRVQNAHVLSDASATDGKSLEIKAIYENIGLTCWYGPCTYTSARLLTKNKWTWQYGKIEIRAKNPSAPGIWPAFWMLGSDIDANQWPNCGEIDIMEQIGTYPARNYGTIHGPGYSGANGIGAQYNMTSGAFKDAYHTFAVEWGPNVIRWYVDGILYETRTPADLPAGTNWVYNHPFFLLLNLAVGSNANWPGVADSSYYPQSLLVDYVRVYRDASLPTNTPTPTPQPSTPYSGTPVAMPGHIEAENFDRGGEGSAYHETDTTNQGNVTTRSSDAPGVDLATTTTGSIVLNYLAPGEWYKYTVNVPTAGTYTFKMNHAGLGGGIFHVETSTGVNLTGSVTQPSTGSWDTFAVYTQQVTLPAGTYAIKFVADAGSGNLNNVDWFEFTGGTPVTNTSVPTNAPTNTPTQVSGNGSPYGGTAVSLPGKVEVENFNTGGEGVAYHDTDTTNNGSQYRTTEGVDIEASTDTGAGYDVGWTAAGEWEKYTVNVASSGTYNLDFRVASAQAGGSFHLEVDGTNVTGALTVPNTGGWQTWTTVSKTGVSLTAGQHVLRLVMDAAGGNFNWINFTTVTPPTNTPTPTNTSVPTTTPTQVSGNGNPYGGTAVSLPGKVEVENFNTGGEGVAYHDTDTTNNGSQYRTTEGVDIEASTDTGAGYNVGWTSTGEWEKYTVNVTTGGTYNMDFRVASAQAGGSFHLEVDGTNVTGILTVPNTGGWQTWTTVSKTGVSLTAGQHVLRLFMDSTGGNFNWMNITSSVVPTATQQPTFAPPTNTPSTSRSNVLYVIDGASTTVNGTLSFTAGASALTDAILSAGGVNHDGTPTNQVTYVISGVSGTYDSTKVTQFNMYVDAGTNVGCATQVRVSYDFNGDGTYDRVETYNYFATDPVASWENYTQANNIKAATGSFANMTNGRVKVELWSAIGNGDSSIRTSATSANGQQSTVTIPFINVAG